MSEKIKHIKECHDYRYAIDCVMCGDNSDLFAGSFSTIFACRDTNRRFVGCEIESEYCEIAENYLL